MTPASACLDPASVDRLLEPAVGPPLAHRMDLPLQVSPEIARDGESRAWIADLTANGQRREDARRRLHELLLGAARFEIGRRRNSVSHVHGGDFEDLANQAADDALVAVLAKLHTYRGRSRFTTWAYKFALLEAGVRMRRRAWQGREVALDPGHWATIAAVAASPTETAESNELVAALAAAMRAELSPRQRQVLVAVAIEGVPIDVLADRLGSTRGALYKMIHDARRKLRGHLAANGLRFDDKIREVVK
jgi:RNA polymerase sigma-70 factor (ECF subfamily)